MFIVSELTSCQTLRLADLVAPPPPLPPLPLPDLNPESLVEWARIVRTEATVPPVLEVITLLVGKRSSCCQLRSKRRGQKERRAGWSQRDRARQDLPLPHASGCGGWS